MKTWGWRAKARVEKDPVRLREPGDSSSYLERLKKLRTWARSGLVWKKTSHLFRSLCSVKEFFRVRGKGYVCSVVQLQ